MTKTPRLLFSAIPLLLIAAVFALAGGPAEAQVPGPFTIDHYRVYKTDPTIPITGPVTLRDQFGETTHNELLLDRFAVPVDKNGEGILDPGLHYSWWHLIDVPLPTIIDVVIRNQFGEQTVKTYGIEYLLTPALKNPQAGQEVPKNRDHYKCHFLIGDRVLADASLSDQFVSDQVTVFEPLWLCNPTEKELADGTVFPIINPDEHLVCYKVTVFTDPMPSILFADQFVPVGQDTLSLSLRDILCVPSEKEEIVQVEPQSWGQVKSTYR